MREFRTLSVGIQGDNVATLELARPSKSNAVDLDMWDELPLALKYLDHRDDVRVVCNSAGAACSLCYYTSVLPQLLISKQGWPAPQI